MRNFNHNHFNRSFRPANNRKFSGRNQRKALSFDPALLVKKAVDQVQTVFVPKNNFADFNLSSQIKKSIADHGYFKPTAIQDQVIPLILEGKDVIGVANTGTGKTAAFLLPLINKVQNNRSEKVLMVAPTRELAAQINDEFRNFARELQLFSVLCIGGVSMFQQIKDLRRRPNFIVGTPGRLKDLERRGEISLADFHSIVLDEVDRMLDMGFINDIRYLISRLPKERQSLFFSATLPHETQVLAQDFLRNPITVSVQVTKTSANVDQDIIKVDGRNKIDLLHDLLIQEGFCKVLIFGRTKWGIEKLTKILQERGFKAAALHGNKSQYQRQTALERFKNSEIQILLATDIASRGLDINDVTHVINYEIPETYEDYIHRIGRTGRADKKGKAITFIA